MKRIGVITEDRRLYQKIRLALGDGYECLMLYDTDSRFGIDVVLLDNRDSAPAHKSDVSGEAIGGYIQIVRRDIAIEGMLGYPFTFAELSSAIENCGESSAPRLCFDSETRNVMLDGRRVHLTEVEYRLLTEICRGGGEYVSREALARAVWGEDATSGVLSVYIHYLREKLEATGEKVIVSSRGGGYKIQDKYIGGGR